jgi:hypothetical protein
VSTSVRTRVVFHFVPITSCWTFLAKNITLLLTCRQLVMLLKLSTAPDTLQNGINWQTTAGPCSAGTC